MTSSPRATSRRTTRPPTKPVAPVTSTVLTRAPPRPTRSRVEAPEDRSAAPLRGAARARPHGRAPVREPHGSRRPGPAVVRRQSAKTRTSRTSARKLLPDPGQLGEPQQDGPDLAAAERRELEAVAGDGAATEPRSPVVRVLIRRRRAVRRRPTARPRHRRRRAPPRCGRARSVPRARPRCRRPPSRAHRSPPWCRSRSARRSRCRRRWRRRRHRSVRAGRPAGRGRPPPASASGSSASPSGVGSSAVGAEAAPRRRPAGRRRAAFSPTATSSIATAATAARTSRRPAVEVRERPAPSVGPVAGAAVLGAARAATAGSTTRPPVRRSTAAAVRAGGAAGAGRRERSRCRSRVSARRRRRRGPVPGASVGRRQGPRRAGLGLGRRVARGSERPAPVVASRRCRAGSVLDRRGCDGRMRSEATGVVLRCGTGRDAACQRRRRVVRRRSAAGRTTSSMPSAGRSPGVDPGRPLDDLDQPRRHAVGEVAERRQRGGQPTCGDLDGVALAERRPPAQRPRGAPARARRRRRGRRSGRHAAARVRGSGRSRAPCPVRVSRAVAAPSARAIPKSASLATPSVVTSTLPGLTSRWTMPAGARCRARAATWAPTRGGEPGRQRPVAQHVAEVDPLDQLHHEVVVVAVAAEVVDEDGVRVGQLRGRRRLGAEARRRRRGPRRGRRAAA